MSSAHEQRIGVSPTEVSSTELAAWVKSLVVPRPIAWVGTTSADGVTNLAPHSFFTMVSSVPPILMFSSERRVQEGADDAKDTLVNVLETGEFTVSIVTQDNHLLANHTSAALPPEKSEFDDAGVTPTPSTVVQAPGVLESPATIECRLIRTDEIGDGTAVYGEVVHVSVGQDVVSTDKRGRALPDPRKLQPVARLGRNKWAELGTIFPLNRPVI